MNINLYVDDLRRVPENFIVARSYEEAVKILNENNIYVLSLDHDLGVDKNGNLAKTGYDLVKYICEKGIYIKKIYIHTDNPVGRDNMYQTLVSAKRRGFLDKDMEIYHYPITENIY